MPTFPQSAAHLLKPFFYMVSRKDKSTQSFANFSSIRKACTCLVHLNMGTPSGTDGIKPIAQFCPAAGFCGHSLYLTIKTSLITNSLFFDVI
jgi:hypothetical protein